MRKLKELVDLELQEQFYSASNENIFNDVERNVTRQVQDDNSVPAQELTENQKSSVDTWRVELFSNEPLDCYEPKSSVDTWRVELFSNGPLDCYEPKSSVDTWRVELFSNGTLDSYEPAKIADSIIQELKQEVDDEVPLKLEQKIHDTTEVQLRRPPRNNESEHAEIDDSKIAESKHENFA